MSPHQPTPTGNGLVSPGTAESAGPSGDGLVSPHQPTRPSWRCASCGDDWPCRRRRDELVVECGGSVVALALAMAQYFAAAVVDHPRVPPAMLYLRFLGWLRQPQR